MRDILERVRASAERSGIRDMRIAVAVSGGGDSVALFWALDCVRAELGLNIHLVHVDHGWRREAADDATFCVQVAARTAAGSSVVRLVPPVRPSETEARHLRHAALRHVARAVGARAVALAHNLDDQAETTFMQMLRGAASPIGMAEWEQGLWRPLLGTTRAELRAFLAEIGASHLEDPTNLSDAFLRNRVRHDILPRLRAENPGVTPAIARLARFAREDDDALTQEAEAALGAAAHVPGGILIGADARTLALPVLRRMVRETMRSHDAEVDSSSVDLAVEALTSGTRAELKRKLWVESFGIWWGEAPPPAVTLLPAGRVRYGRLVVGVGAPPPDAETLALPAEGTLTVRSRLPGDRMARANGHRKLQDLFVDRKVPRPLRDHLPIIALDGEPVWLPGEGTRTPGVSKTPWRTVWVWPGSVVRELWGVVK